MSTILVRVGPADHGRRMSLKDFERAAGAGPRRRSSHHAITRPGCCRGSTFLVMPFSEQPG
jgi:hypothetical protein